MQGGAGKILDDALGVRSILYPVNGAFAFASHSHLLACGFASAYPRHARGDRPAVAARRHDDVQCV